MRKTALTIAGSDCSGGAGIQADIKTMMANGVYAMSAVTALTAQNTQGVEAVMNVPPDFLAKQLNCVFTDIFPDAVKIGMMSSAALIRVTAEKLKEYGACRIVLDPVMISTSGSRLLDEDAVRVLQEELLPLSCASLMSIPASIPQTPDITSIPASIPTKGPVLVTPPFFCRMMPPFSPACSASFITFWQ